MLEAIFFDLDDTLLITDGAHREAVTTTCAAAARRCSAIDPGALETVYLQVGNEIWLASDLPPALESAVDFRRKIWAAALERVGVRDELLVDVLATHHTEERRAGYCLFPDALETLQRLHGRYHLGIITNGITEIQREKIGCLGIAPYFDAILISQEAGIAKPDAGIFEQALTRIRCKPWEAVMVGDSLARDIDGARNAGLHSLWVRLGRPAELWTDHFPARDGGPGEFEPGLTQQTAHATLDNLGELLPWLEQRANE